MYAKRPFDGPDQVIEYLGCNTYMIAISNHGIYDQTVQYTYMDYRQLGTKKEMAFSAVKFIRRITLHILPKGFVWIQYYGMLSNVVMQTTLLTIREQLTPKIKALKKRNLLQYYPPFEVICPCCKKDKYNM
ncbi:transposase [Flavihumibacter cheonanensis]|uniref:transposase n=1 Tax=Flavihumibacter cheonanensis TaxID=1442385 RepID=UPI001EF992B4|nr:transposase [Flavihumibacter cheonanensis]